VNVSHYSPHRTARFCFSHETIYRPPGCQATALTIDLKQNNKISGKFNELFHTNSDTNRQKNMYPAFFDQLFYIYFLFEQNKNKTIPCLKEMDTRNSRRMGYNLFCFFWLFSRFVTIYLRMFFIESFFDFSS
jgi:hypothetical protein